jgi:hypothetical protein
MYLFLMKILLSLVVLPFVYERLIHSSTCATASSSSSSSSASSFPRLIPCSSSFSSSSLLSPKSSGTGTPVSSHEVDKSIEISIGSPSQITAKSAQSTNSSLTFIAKAAGEGEGEGEAGEKAFFNSNSETDKTGINEEMNNHYLIMFGFLLIVVHAWWIIDIVFWCYGVY